MKTVVVAYRPGSKLAGAPLSAFEEEFNKQNARVKKVDIRRITGPVQGDVVFVYNSSYRIHEKNLLKIGPKIFNVPRGFGKDVQYKILQEHDVPMPKYYVVNRSSDLNFVCDNLGLPIITKPIIGTGGRGVRIHRKREDFIRFIGNDKVIAQEYIEEASSGDIRALVIDDKVVCSLWRTPAQGKIVSNFHAGGKPSKVDLSEEEKSVAIMASRAMGLSVSGVDIVRTKDGPLVFEANSVPDLMHIYEVGGVNAIPDFVSSILKSA